MLLMRLYEFCGIFWWQEVCGIPKVQSCIYPCAKGVCKLNIDGIPQYCPV
jgi:hypothetical protein